MENQNSAKPNSAVSATPKCSTEFVQQWIAALAEHYRVELSELQVLLYLKGLADMGNMEVERGCSQALKDCKFMPTVADIREGCRKWRQEYLPPSNRVLDEPPMSEEQKKEIAAKLAQLAGKKEMK